MEINDQNIQEVASVLQNTLAAQNDTRMQAEKQLNTLVGRDGFPVLLLKIVDASNAPLETRQAGATYFKNLVKKHWEIIDGEPTKISANDRTLVKEHLINLMCSAPTLVQNLLSEAVSCISQQDYPDQWPHLIKQLREKLDLTNIHVTMGVLRTVNSVCKRFRGAFDNDETRYVLKHILDDFQEPLLQLFTAIAQQTEEHKSNKEALEPRFEALRIMARIFYSLNWITIPEFFEDHIQSWMQMFKGFLAYKNPVLAYPDETEEAGPVERLQTAILRCIHLYSQKYDEEFSSYFQTFVTLTWELLNHLSHGGVAEQPRYDELAAIAIKFLSSAVGQTMHAGLFQDENTLRGICQNIVVPNIMLRDADEELFEDNPVEYTTRDMDGSDTDTRRRAAADLVRSLCKNFETSITQMCLQFSQQLLQKYAADPANHWKDKDAALNLMAAIAVKAETRAYGVTEIRENINVVDILKEHVFPELQRNPPSADPAASSSVRWEVGHAIVKATCIKLVCMFRNQLTGPMLDELLPVMAQYLNSSTYVVYSYAATTIERFLCVTDNVSLSSNAQSLLDTSAWSIRMSRDAVGANVKQILTNALTRLSSTPDQSVSAADLQQFEHQLDNEHLMKCIMRVLSVGGSHAASCAEFALPRFQTILMRIFQNPRNPTFNHYVFESLVLFIRWVCHTQPAAADHFEQILFPAFNVVLQKEISEFVSYVFQVMAVLLMSRPQNSVLSGGYRSLFPALLRPEMWDDRGKFAALVTLVQAYVRKAPEFIVEGNYLSPVLGVFQKLIASVASEDHAFRLLNSIFLHIPQQVLSGQLVEIMKIVLKRMSSNKTAKFARQFIRSCSVFAKQHGGKALVGAINAVQSGLFFNILVHVIVPNLTKVRGSYNRKTVVIGIACILRDVDELGVPEQKNTIVELISHTIQVLDGDVEVHASAEEKQQQALMRQAEQAAEEEQYSAQYSRLRFAIDTGDEAHPIDSNYFPESKAEQELGQALKLIQSRLPGANEEAAKKLHDRQKQSLYNLITA